MLLKIFNDLFLYELANVVPNSLARPACSGESIQK